MNKSSEPLIIPATIADYPIIQNMARFYVYDLSRECGSISSEWAMPANGLYECFDFKIYFEDERRFPYLIKIGNELAGFILVDKEVKDKKSHWNMGEFFVIAKFQSKGVGKQVARQIFDEYHGVWEVSVIPENRSGLIFWEGMIGVYSRGKFNCETKIVDFDEYQPHRIIFTFDSNKQNKSVDKMDVIVRSAILSDVPLFVRFSYSKRLDYEKAQPQFWKYAGDSAEDSQKKWFEELLTRDDYIILTATRHDVVVGFIIGKLMPAPEVYNPGGLTLMIDDFCVETESDWRSVGVGLITEIKNLAKAKDAVQILVVCGAHDDRKRIFLKSIGLTVVSEWYVGGII